MKSKVNNMKLKVKKTAYPKIIDAIIDSLYNQALEGKSGKWLTG